MSTWAEHVKKYAADNKVSYKAALTAAKDTYKKKVSDMPRKKKEKKEEEMHEKPKAEKKDDLVKKDKQKKRETAAEAVKPKKMAQLM